MSKDKKHMTRRALILVLACALTLAALAAGVTWYFLRDKAPEPFEFDTAALEGRIKSMTDAEIQEELNRIVEEGMFNISIASNIVFAAPDAEGEARIENIAANPYHMQVDIALDEVVDPETGEITRPRELVYQSKGLKPGTYIEFIRLMRELEPGEYDATASFSAITQDSYRLVGTAAAKIKLTILGELPTPTPTPVTTSMADTTPTPGT